MICIVLLLEPQKDGLLNETLSCYIDVFRFCHIDILSSHGEFLCAAALVMGEYTAPRIKLCSLSQIVIPVLKKCNAISFVTRMKN